MTAKTETTSYSYERLCFDRWAAWADGHWESSLGLPRDTLLSRVARFGIRVGVSRSGSEPEIHDEPLIVSSIMEAWASSSNWQDRYSHSALMARHRRVINSVKISQLTDEEGKPKRFRDRDFALLIIGSSEIAAIQAFRRLCQRGYTELRLKLAAPLR